MLPFDYTTLAITALLEQALHITQVEPEIVEKEVTSIAAKLGTAVTPNEILAAYEFQRKRRQVYSTFTPEETTILQILDNPNFFPENVEDFKTIVGADSPLVEHHNAFYEFWRSYAIHTVGRDAIVSAGRLFGATHSAVYSDVNYPTVYHRGMVEVDPEAKRIAETYDLVKERLSFTPAIATPNALVLAPYDLVVDFLSDHPMVSLATLGGRFFFEGGASDGLPGSFNFKSK